MALTRVLDKPLEPIALAFGYRPEDIGIGFGTAAITKGIEIIEDLVAKGWWKVTMYALGSLTTLYFGGKSTDPRTKLESAIISGQLAGDLVRVAVEEWEDVHDTISQFAEAVARGDIEAALNTMVNTEIADQIMSMISGTPCQSTEVTTPPIPLPPLPTPTGSATEATVKARG